MTTTVPMLTDEEIEALAFKHETGGAGLAEGGGLSSHFFCADDIGPFSRAIEQAVRAQFEAKSADSQRVCDSYANENQRLHDERDAARAQCEVLREAVNSFLDAQGALDNRELLGLNAPDYETLMRQRNCAMAELDDALSAGAVEGETKLRCEHKQTETIQSGATFLRVRCKSCGEYIEHNWD